MSGLYLIQVAMCFCFMGGYYGQPLYEDRCRNNLVNGMDQRLKEAYGKIWTNRRLKNRWILITKQNPIYHTILRLS